MISDKKRKGKSRSVNVSLPVGVRARAEAAARTDDRSLTRWVVRACWAALGESDLPPRVGTGGEMLYLDLDADLLGGIEADMARRKLYAPDTVVTVTEFVRRAVVAALSG